MVEKKQIDVAKLTKAMFWDVRFDLLDPIRDLNFIVFRVLNRGYDPDVEHLLSVLSFQEIYDIIRDGRDIDEMTINHFRVLSNAERRQRT